MAFSILAIIIGLAGLTCGMEKCRNDECKCSTYLFGISLMIVWLVYLVVGIVIAGTSATAQEGLNDFCEGNADPRIAFMTDTVDKIDSAVGMYSSTFMCSSECYCASEDI